MQKVFKVRPGGRYEFNTGVRYTDEKGAMRVPLDRKARARKTLAAEFTRCRIPSKRLIITTDEAEEKIRLTHATAPEPRLLASYGKAFRLVDADALYTILRELRDNCGFKALLAEARRLQD